MALHVTRPPQRVESRFGVPDIVVLGLGGMLGAGAFVGFAPASGAAGGWLLVGIVLAAFTALCCAFSTADQSAAYRGSGGGYVYTREQLGRWPGRMAGSALLGAKTAAAAAIAGGFAVYLVPERATLVAVGLIVAATVVNLVGLRWARWASWLVVVIGLAVLIMVVIACFAIAPPAQTTAVPPSGQPGSHDPRGLITAAGLMFFGFIGFERITAPGDGQPQHAQRRLHLAIPVVIGTAFVVYLLLGLALLRQLGPARLAFSPAPLRDALVAANAADLVPAVDVGLAVVLAAAMVLVLAALRRAVLAVTAERSLPLGLGRLGRGGVAWRADLIGGVGAIAMVLLMDPATALKLAACCMLVYYAFTNAAARLLVAEERSWPTRTACAGMFLSVILAMSLPPMTLLTTALVIGAGTSVAALLSSRWR